MTERDELPTYRTAGPADRAGDDPAYRLVVVEGPDAGTSCPIDGSSPARVLVGTSPMCTLRLGDRAVSRRHLAIRAYGVELVVTDLGSTNGTTVNGVSVREAALRGGEAIRIGSTVMNVHRGPPLPHSEAQAGSFGRLLGTSPAMSRLVRTLQEIMRAERAVLLDGEVGVGKKLIAEEIHAHSSRVSHPFAIASVHALGADAVEEHIFGEAGLLVTTAGGTLYIDEIAALPLSTQGRLLAALDAGGGPATTRLVLGTKRDLDQDVQRGRVREDLLARLAVCRVEVPPLREREGDVQVIAEALWEVLAEAEPEHPERTLPRDFVARFEDYPWPGNVQELVLAVSARFNLGEMVPWRGADRIRPGEDFLGALIDKELTLPDARRVIVDEFERRYVGYMMARYGNSRDAAAASGVAVRYFQLLRARAPR